MSSFFRSFFAALLALIVFFVIIIVLGLGFISAVSSSLMSGGNTVIADKTVLVATGNPGRIYRLDPAKFAQAGVAADRITDTKLLADHGLTLFGEARDRNVRRIAVLADGRVAAGSAPNSSASCVGRIATWCSTTPAELWS